MTQNDIHHNDLNPEQRRAVEHASGPILILAGAGSGKTRVLTRRVMHLIHHFGVRPDRILAVTFTNKATKEMKERLEYMLEKHEQGPAEEYSQESFFVQNNPDSKQRKPWIATFHSACLRILRQHAKEFGFQRDFAVYDTQDSKGVMKEVLADMSLSEADPQTYLRLIDKAKNAGISAERFSSEKTFFNTPHDAEVYLAYQSKLLQSNAMDYGDLLLFTLELLRKNSEILSLYQNYLEHVLVDEFQDTNLVQYDIIRLLTAKKRNLLVVGDDDQSIYAFRGASIANILEFEKDFPDATLIKLEQNYRSTQTILDAGHAVVSKNKSRREKKLWTDNPQGERIVGHLGFDEDAEASFVAREIERLHRLGGDYAGMAVFYRTNAQSRALEEALMDSGIPYRIFGGLKFYDRKEIKDLISYLRLLANPADSQAFFRIINTPTRGIGAQSLQTIVLESVTKEISLLEAARNLRTRNKGVAQFVGIFDELLAKKEKAPVAELLSDIIALTGYVEKLQESKDASALSRIENIRELQGLAESFARSGVPKTGVPEAGVLKTEQLREFLDRVSLTTADESITGESESQSKTSSSSVSLMTLHLAKGLEFPFVFLTGCEEGLLPHYRSKEEGTTDEERRLCYVGITRAQKKLYITRAESRSMFSAAGSFGSEGRFRKPSQFLFDIPRSLIEAEDRFFVDDAFADGDDDVGNPFASRKSLWNARAGTQGKGKKFFPQSRAIPQRKVQGIMHGAFHGTKNPLTGLPGLLTAENLLEQKKAQEPGAPLSLDELIEGLEVFHPSFGGGTVQGIEHSPSVPERSKVTVYFPALQAAKRLVYKYAQLSR